jgi:hypothetical protein
MIIYRPTILQLLSLTVSLSPTANLPKTHQLKKEIYDQYKKLPLFTVPKPHCGVSPNLSSGTAFAASSIFDLDVKKIKKLKKKTDLTYSSVSTAGFFTDIIPRKNLVLGNAFPYSFNA